MSQPRQSRLRRPWLILAALAFLLIVPFLLFRSAPFERLSSWLTSTAKPKPAFPQPELPISQGEDESHDFYGWPTRSAFNPVRHLDAANKSIEDLCAAFPTHLLHQIQPVLKTGHGVLDARVRPQFQSVSACLTNLLIFSDVDERFEEHDIIDIIADIPGHLTDKEEQLEPWRNGSLSQDNATKNVGWKTDKFKFLPAISRAWRMRPRRRWYVFYEADTYIVWDNVFRLLANFDPDTPHYFGSPSPGRVPGPGQPKTWFANGGPGYILSREAMRRLIQGDWSSETGEYLGSKLTEACWKDLRENCCGDSVLGWALWERNVSLSGLWPMFNPHPPHGVPFAAKYWCQPVLTMHKPSEEDILGLWHWQWEHRVLNRPLLYRDLAMSYFKFANLTTRENWNNGDWADFAAPVPSTFYSHDPHESFDACESGCRAHNECFQWRYHLRKCSFIRSFRLGRYEEPSLCKAGKKKCAEDASIDWKTEDLKWMSGWDTEKITSWMYERPCEEVQWVRPSIERIF